MVTQAIQGYCSTNSFVIVKIERENPPTLLSLDPFDKIVLEWCGIYGECYREVNLSKQRARHSKVSINDVKKLAIS